MNAAALPKAPAITLTDINGRPVVLGEAEGHDAAHARNARRHA